MTSWHTRSSRLVFCFALALLLLPLQNCVANYVSEKCRKATDGGTELQTPLHLLRNFRVLSERATLRGGENIIAHGKLWYESSSRQAVRYTETADSRTWLHLDEIKNDCIFAEENGRCQDQSDTCSTKAPEFFGEDRKVNVGSYRSILQWPSEGKKQVSMGKSAVRGMDTQQYVTCDYDQTNDLTVVSEWHFLDSQKYSDSSRSWQQLLMARHQRFNTNGEKVSDERIDYTDYTYLRYSDVRYGLQISEGECKHVDGYFHHSPKPPAPSALHGFYQVTDYAFHSLAGAQEEFTMYVEYNLEARMIFEVIELPSGDVTEKNTIVNVHDFSTTNKYSYSVTNGYCKVHPHNNYLGHTSIPSPQSFWLFSPKRNYNYLGVYMNRNIPCNTWLFEFPAGDYGMAKGGTITLFAATADWLEQNGKPRDMFYPVQRITRPTTEIEKFDSFFEYKDNPGYHIPDLWTCFDEKDTVVGKITLENTNFYKTYAHQEVFLQYEIRKFLQKITGIKSAMRLARIVGAPNRENVEETDIAFTIYGHFVGNSSILSEAYKADPVTSQQAADKINKVVDSGDAKFTLQGTVYTLHLKKGSFEVLKNYDHFENVDNPRRQSSGGGGYSSVALASVSVTLLVVTLLLGLLLVVVYKRWTEGQDILPSLSLQSMSGDKA